MVWKLKFSLFKQAYKISQLMEISKWTLKHLELSLKIFVTLLENLKILTKTIWMLLQKELQLIE